MSVDELKKKLTKQVETLSEDQLLQVQDFLKSLTQSSREIDLSSHVDNIVNERAEVLKKLAQ